MTRTTKKTRTRRTFTDDEKRAIVAEIGPKKPVAAVAKKHGLQWATLSAWRGKFGSRETVELELIPAAPAPAATNGKTGLVALRALVVDELMPIIDRELPAALDRALGRVLAHAYGKTDSPSTSKHG